jgi:outer membrane protein assembly factor BamE (lipoprotein component of BamABCDE complex)
MNTSILCRRLFSALGVCLALALAGCSLMPERVAPGTPRAQIEAQLGKPTMVHALPQGTRLQYSGQPAGQWVHNLDLDTDGRLVRYQQVMDAGWLQQNIQVGRWSRDDVLLNLGRPGAVERVARFDGVVWTYRFLEATRPRQVHVHLDPAGVVRQLMFTDEPLYDDPADSASHP